MIWESSDHQGGFTTGKPWLPVPQEQLPLAASAQESDPQSVLSAYRTALKLRKDHPAIARGGIKFLSSDNGLLLFERTLGESRILCAFNFSTDDKSVPELQGARESISSFSADGPALGGFGWRIAAL